MKAVEAAAASKKLMDRVSGRTVALPEGDHHIHLQRISILLTEEENAALNAERYKNGACLPRTPSHR